MAWMAGTAHERKPVIPALPCPAALRLVLGLLIGLSLNRQAALLAGTATVGAYTTFSTWMFETQRLGEDRQVRPLLGNIVVSLGAGLGAAAVGQWIGTLT